MTLFGPTTSEAVNNAGMAPTSLQFNQWLANAFQPVGINGVPDLATHPMDCYQYLNNKRDVILGAANQKPLVRIADKNLNIKATIGEEVSCTVEELMADSGKATCIIRFDNWLTDWIVNQNSIYEDLHLIVDPIPTQPDWRTRWGGKITEVNIKNNEDGTSTVELVAISMREHVKRLLFAANPIFPPEIQLPRMWVLPGPTRSILFLSMFINLARIFTPILSGITNAFNPAAWINPLNPDAALNIDPLSWPLQVAFVNPVTDQSRWSVLGATWTDWHSSMADMLSDAGVVCRAYTWLTTDVDSPHTELTGLINGVEEVGVDLLGLVGLGSVDDLVGLVGNDVESLARPTRNCVVFSLEDDSGQTGPTGTAIDGLLNLIGVTGDDLITSVLFDTNTGQQLNGEPIIDSSQPVSPVIQSLLGVAPAPPKVIWRDGQFTGMIKREVTMHKAPVLTVMTGGRSPAIVNQAQTFAIKWGLSQISDLINPGFISPINTAYQMPLTNGLDSLYQGQLDNVLLAWERYTDPVRAVYGGDLQFQEYFDKGSSTAYTMAGWLTLREANFKTRPFYGFTTDAVNGRPWLIDVDVRLGQRAGFEIGGIIYVDQISAVKRTYDRKTPVVVSMSVGDDRNKHDPIAQAVRAMSAMWMAVGALFGEGTLFG
jgi:hypothetical protein